MYVLVRSHQCDGLDCLQKCEDDVERLPGEIEAHLARVAQLTEELAGAEAEVERLAEAARPEREALTKKQQAGAALCPGIRLALLVPAAALTQKMYRYGC